MEIKHQSIIDQFDKKEKMHFSGDLVSFTVLINLKTNREKYHLS